MADAPKFTVMIEELTKRELFAAMAMQGLLNIVRNDEDREPAALAKWSTRYADALLAELAK